jgi:hypothetical protein
MGDLIKYFPVDDIATSVAESFKRVLISLPEFTQDKPGFVAPANSLKELVFPEVGVDFRTVTISGHTGSYYPQVLTPHGITAKLVFDTFQDNDITVDPYKAFTSYAVGSIDDLPFDVGTWAGAPETDKSSGDIPIIIPVLQDYQITRNSGRGEHLYLMGYFTVYGGANQGGISKVKAETAKLYHAIRNNTGKFTAEGFTQLLIDPPQFRTFSDQTVMYEGSIRYGCVVRIF